METSYYLTTFDNPFDPSTDFLHWFCFDEEKGYHSCAFLSRIARTSDQLSDEENMKEIERAIDEIIRYDFQGIYKKLAIKEQQSASTIKHGATCRSDTRHIHGILTPIA